MDETFRQRLRRVIIDALLADPPHPLEWFNNCNEDIRASIRQIACNPDVSVVSALGEFNLQDLHLQCVLMLRGLLSFYLLEHCLEIRHRVQYGLDLHHKRTKLLAVPFQAADVPTEKSEFSHPDKGILVTILSYYYSGLTMEQFAAAAEKLLTLGPCSQNAYYSLWFSSVKESLTPDVAESIDSPIKIDTTNSVRMKFLYEAYRFCTETINFWLNAFVIPNDSIQYPQKIMSSAWSLPGQHSIGFSGTNDSKSLLPLSVKQNEAPVSKLLATNASMIQKLMEVAEISKLEVSSEIPLWKGLIDQVLTDNLTGSLLAGVANKDAAMEILSHSKFNRDKFTGVVFFETKSSPGTPNGQWMVLDIETGLSLPRSKSPKKDRVIIILCCYLS